MRAISLAILPLILTALALPGDSAAAAVDNAASSDWTGFYTLARAKDLQGTGFMTVNGDLDKTIVAHLQPWAKLKMEATDGSADDTGAVCKPDGLFRNPPFAGRFWLLPSKDMIALVFDEINTAGVHRIYLNRGHPPNLRPSWNGDSVGHWENGTLVADTIGFNDKSWLMSAMEPHTEETHMIERISSVAGGRFIEIKTVVEDRHALTSAYTYTRYYKKSASLDQPENICNDDLSLWLQWRAKALKKQNDAATTVK